MKKFIYTVLGVFMTFVLQAQIDIPAASPMATLTQTVGLTQVKIAYSRPSMKGRKIFDSLIPYGSVWRTGANATTKFTIDKPVEIDQHQLAAGTYSIYTIPGEDSWEIIFYTDDSNPLITTIDNSKIALRTMADVQQFPVEVETFTISIDQVSAEGATLGLLWESTYVGIPFTVDTDKEVMASIDNALNGPDAGEYYNAAVYYLNSGKDIKQANTWMQKAMSMTADPKFWQLRQQSLILAKAGDKKAAVEAAKKSLKAAKEAGNEDYIRMNTASLKEWGAL